MAVENLKEKLAAIVSKEPSKWMQEAQWRSDNKTWLKKSQAIAIKVLKTLKEKGLSQKELAASLFVSPQQINKICKGTENLTLAKLENALGIQLIEVVEVQKDTDTNKETLTYSTSTELLPKISSFIADYDTQNIKAAVLIKMEYDIAKGKYSYTKENAA